MKFLIGLILGGALAVGIMSNPEPRHQLLQAVTHLVEKAKQFSPAPRTADSRATQNVNPPVAATETAPPVSHSEIGQEAVEPVNTSPMAHQVIEETNDLATGVTEEEDVPYSALGTSLFQVAWSPFKSETSARGFAARLERQVSQEFQVIKMGPGRYEVGFLFESEPERSAVLNAINEITGFESTTPPRILGI